MVSAGQDRDAECLVRGRLAQLLPSGCCRCRSARLQNTRAAATGDGVLLTSFETSHLVRSNLPPLPKGDGFSGGTWTTCNQVTGCDKRVDKQLAQRIPGLCNVGVASVATYGWVTQTPGRYGHLGLYARELYEDEVIAVGPPPDDLVEQMRSEWAKAGIGKCP